MRSAFSGVVSFVAPALVALGCAAETPEDESVSPDISVDTSVSKKDVAATHDGWTQYPFVDLNITYSSWMWGWSVSRSGGPATRNGGTCLVEMSQDGCSVDTNCTATAVARYGSVAAGYCYEGKCLYRPGSQGGYCNFGVNRSPGIYYGDPFYAQTAFERIVNATGGAAIGALGCMSKTTAQACAPGADPSGYVRTLNGLEFSGYPNF